MIHGMSSVIRYNAKYVARVLYFWIDFACIHYDDRPTGIAALPAYVATCNDMLCYETPDYSRRAWSGQAAAIGRPARSHLRFRHQGVDWSE
jgi:hypothetical protein